MSAPQFSLPGSYHGLLEEVRRRQMDHKSEWAKDCCRKFMSHTVYFLAKKQPFHEVVTSYVKVNDFHMHIWPHRETFCRKVNGKCVALATYKPLELFKKDQ